MLVLFHQIHRTILNDLLALSTYPGLFLSSKENLQELGKFNGQKSIEKLAPQGNWGWESYL